MKTKIKTRTMKRFGWLPDLPDHRDWTAKPLKLKLGALPTKADLRPGCSPIENQFSLGSCTANALAGAVEFLELKNGAKFEDASRLFIYYNERVIMGTVNEDSGAYLRDGIKSLVKQGVCDETLWPYKMDDFTKKPSEACYTQAKKHTIESYYRLATLHDMKACLADGDPFVFGFTVYESFTSATVAKTGVLNLPKADESVVGGHAVLAVGYSDTDKRFIVRNSWGKSWGQDGYYTMPYKYLEDRNLSDDFWTIRK
jgi:C1A family cysteine protease